MKAPPIPKTASEVATEPAKAGERGVAGAFEDNRDSTAVQRRLGESSGRSRSIAQLKAMSGAAGASEQVKQLRELAGMANRTVQRKIQVPGTARYYEQGNDFNVTEVAPQANLADYAATPDSPATNPRKDYARQNMAGYLVNISSMNKTGAPAAEHHGDVEAKYTVARYNQGFANATEAKNRLRMVINVNQYNDVLIEPGAAAPPTALGNAVATQRGDGAITGASGKSAVVGHLWGPTWKRGDTNAVVPAATVRAAYQSQRVGTPAATLKNGYAEKGAFRFGQMRETTFRHPQTANFKTHFDNRHLTTFVHLGDGDVVDTRVGGQGVYDRMDTWRGASAGNRNKKLIGGGVEYKGTDQGGDAPAAQGPLVKVLSDVDMNNRDAMARVDGRAPWMTEPNTFVRHDVLAGIDRGGQKRWNDLKGFMVDMGSALTQLVGPGEAAFDAKALSIVSSANTHKVAAADLEFPTIDEYVAGLRNYKDTSFKPGSWINRVAPLVRVGGKRISDAKRLCRELMWEKIGALSDDDAHPKIKAIFLSGRTGTPWTPEERLAAMGAGNVTKAEQFATALAAQCKAASKAYDDNLTPQLASYANLLGGSEEEP